MIEHPPEAEAIPELLALARGGDADAFCRLGRLHEVRLFRQALALCRVAQVAEDLVVETLFEAWRCLGRFDSSCRFSTWLYAIFFRRYLKTVRRARARPASVSDLPRRDADLGERQLGEIRVDAPVPCEVLEREEEAERLLSAIRDLPGIHQQVVLLRFYEDASLNEIAAALGISSGTVKSRLHHALEKLRRSEVVLNLLRERGDS